jgi:hypothetical protein
MIKKIVAEEHVAEERRVEDIIAEQIEEAKKNGGEYQGRTNPIVSKGQDALKARTTEK